MKEISSKYFKIMYISLEKEKKKDEQKLKNENSSRCEVYIFYIKDVKYIEGISSS